VDSVCFELYDLVVIKIYIRKCDDRARSIVEAEE
jgi:hypothetical protein